MSAPEGAQTGLYFEDLEVGTTYSSPRRTITEADVTAFAGLSGDFNPLHTDAIFAAETPFGRRIAHGLLGLSIATGLLSRLGIFDGTVIAFLEIRNWKFRAPIFFGDSIQVEMSVIDKRETSKADRGIVTRAIRILNQSRTVVQEGETVLMMKRRPGSEGEKE